MTGQLYFEDVHEGMQIPSIEKTPTTQQLVKFAAATYDYYQIHFDLEFARNRGLPNVIVHGPLKNAFLGQLMTDWIGEHGTLKGLDAQYRGMDLPASTLVATGVVKKKYVEDGENIVECEIWLENERGEKTTPGYAVVALPSRGR